mgnify:CR=1 FL=1
MVFGEKKEKDVAQVGDIKNNNVSIDTNNIDFIVTILSTNLYSKPIESFIRETVSNAWDSHIEAGVTDPVILELEENSEGAKFCRIQDFGVGLSPERFDAIFKNIGSSTKRGDNTQIGGFGIGRFAALAYSDVVHITSVYEGKKYLYMMYKDGNSISIDLLHEQDTDERNGLEVKLEIQDGDFNNFADAIKSQLVYFENLYVVDSVPRKDTAYNNYIDIQGEYNNFKVKKYDNFWVNTLDTRSEISLILGKVRYPLRVGNLDKAYSNVVAKYPISLKLEIGDVAVTPNREEVLYSSDNKSVIEAKLDAAIAEINVMIEAAKTMDYKKIPEYIDAINSTQYLTLLEVDEEEVRIKMGDSKKYITLNGETYDGKNFGAMYDEMMNYYAVPAQYTLKDEKIKYTNDNISLKNIKEGFSTTFISDLSEVKNITKRYVRETFEDGSCFVKNDTSILTYTKKYIAKLKYIAEKNAKDVSNYGYDRDFTKYDHKAFKVMFHSIVKNLPHLKKFSDFSVPQTWIDDTKAADKLKRGTIKRDGFDWKQNINVHKLRFRDYGGGVMTDSTPYAMKDLSSEFGSLAVYAEKGTSKREGEGSEDLRTLYYYLKDTVAPKMVEVAPTKIKLLDNVENFVKIKDLMSVDYRLIRNIGTVEFLKREIPFLKDLAKINNIHAVSEKLHKVIEELVSFVKKYESARRTSGTQAVREGRLVEEIYGLCEEKNHFNETIRGLFNANKKELLNAQVLLNFTESGTTYGSGNTIPDHRINAVVDYVLSRKMIRPDVKAVLKLKEETIFNIKTEEDEDN